MYLKDLQVQFFFSDIWPWSCVVSLWKPTRIFPDRHAHHWFYLVLLCYILYIKTLPRERTVLLSAVCVLYTLVSISGSMYIWLTYVHTVVLWFIGRKIDWRNFYIKVKTTCTRVLQTIKCSGYKVIKHFFK